MHKTVNSAPGGRTSRKRTICLLTAAAALIAGLTGCSRTETELPDLSSLGDLSIITREDGSGTKDEFEELIDTDGNGANETALSTDQVLEFTSDDRNAIGYLAYSSYAEAASDTASVKAVSVDGITADSGTISDGSYPLCREYLLAYTGELSEAEMDFITYIQGAGQDIVAESCTPIHEATTFLSSQASGTITINGSSSVAPLIEQLAEEYYTYNENVTIEIEVSDSTEGLNAAMRGDCDLAMSSRSLKDYEEELLETEEIAADGIAVIVHADNPLTDISSELLKEIYDGTYSTWSDLNS